MSFTDAEIVVLCERFRARAKSFMRETDGVVGFRDLIRLTAMASTLEWAAGELAVCAGFHLTDSDPPAGALTIPPRSTVIRPVAESQGPVSRPTIDFSELYRAHIEPESEYRVERTAYVQALTEGDARDRIARALAGLEYDKVDRVSERIYNVQSGEDCIKQGVSEDREVRLFETGWSDDRATAFVREPLFLLNNPAALTRKWAVIPEKLSASTGRTGPSEPDGGGAQ